jgi:hypothetical protein
MEVKGLDELSQRFATMQNDVQNAQIGEIINFALAQVEGEAKSKAPVRTGRLRDSIVHYMISDLSGECVAQAPYAGAQEYGFIGKNGQRIPGKNYFMPAAMHGKQTLIAELNKYLIAACQGRHPQAPRAARGARGSGTGGVHKYLQKIQTGAGTRYVYAKTTAATKFRFQGKPGGRKQPSTKFQRKKPGGRHR